MNNRLFWSGDGLVRSATSSIHYNTDDESERKYFVSCQVRQGRDVHVLSIPQAVTECLRMLTDEIEFISRRDAVDTAEDIEERALLAVNQRQQRVQKRRKHALDHNIAETLNIVDSFIHEKLTVDECKERLTALAQRREELRKG